MEKVKLIFEIEKEVIGDVASVMSLCSDVDMKEIVDRIEDEHTVNMDDVSDLAKSEVKKFKKTLAMVFLSYMICKHNNKKNNE